MSGDVFLAHISDLHFGPPFEAVRYQKLTTSILAALASIGYTGRAYYLLVSRDITQCGSKEQFALAQTYLRSKLRFGRLAADAAGFDLPGRAIGLVPGNHDQWKGKEWSLEHPYPPTGYDERIMGSQFRKTPWVKEWESRSGQLKVQIFGMNSNSGVGGSSIRARGVISDEEFTDLEKELIRRRPSAHLGAGVIRLIITHHNLFSPADWKARLTALRQHSFMPSAWPLDDHSREELLRIAAEHNVELILTGHTHDFGDAHLKPRVFHRPVFGDSRLVRELTCATTFKGGRRLEFLIHRAYLQGNTPRWAYWRFHWDKRREMFWRANLRPDADFPLASPNRKTIASN